MTQNPKKTSTLSPNSLVTVFTDEASPDKKTPLDETLEKTSGKTIWNQLREEEDRLSDVREAERKRLNSAAGFGQESTDHINNKAFGWLQLGLAAAILAGTGGGVTAGYCLFPNEREEVMEDVEGDMMDETDFPSAKGEINLEVENLPDTKHFVNAEVDLPSANSPSATGPGYYEIRLERDLKTHKPVFAGMHCVAGACPVNLNTCLPKPVTPPQQVVVLTCRDDNNRGKLSVLKVSRSDVDMDNFDWQRVTVNIR